MKQPRRRGFVETSPDASDRRLRGRTYAIPFDTVWQAALRLTSGGMFRWTCHEADDQDGVIIASTRSLAGAVHDVMVRVGLDENGQTRVDASAQARKPLSDFGRSKRRLRRFFRRLDRALAGRPARASKRGTEAVS
ncbi:MAG TPA: DUF1499 domain-containing protein [Longimicrobiales bacterium]